MPIQPLERIGSSQLNICCRSTSQTAMFTPCLNPPALIASFARITTQNASGQSCSVFSFAILSTYFRHCHLSCHKPPRSCNPSWRISSVYRSLKRPPLSTEMSPTCTPQQSKDCRTSNCENTFARYSMSQRHTSLPVSYTHLTLPTKRIV